jgi:hypothetical protein
LAGEAHGNIVRALVHAAIAALSTALLISVGPRALPSHISDTLFVWVGVIYLVVALGLYWKARYEWNEAKNLDVSIGRRE